MKIALDTYYYEDKAKTVGLIFENWRDEKPSEIVETFSENVLEYESGNFFKRELPYIIDLFKQIDLSIFDTIIVDGYVFLDNNRKKGLGYYLYEYLQNKIPVIGVAKKSFYNNGAIQIIRGKSENPLYISSIGIEQKIAAEFIKNMDGKYRIPTLLKLLDQRTRI